MTVWARMETRGGAVCAAGGRDDGHGQEALSVTARIDVVGGLHEGDVLSECLPTAVGVWGMRPVSVNSNISACCHRNGKKFIKTSGPSAYERL